MRKTSSQNWRCCSTVTLNPRTLCNGPTRACVPRSRTCFDAGTQPCRAGRYRDAGRGLTSLHELSLASAALKQRGLQCDSPVGSEVSITSTLVHRAEIRFHQAADVLRPYVGCFWVMTVEPGATIRIVPDG